MYANAPKDLPKNPDTQRAELLANATRWTFACAPRSRSNDYVDGFLDQMRVEKEEGKENEEI